MDAITTLTLFYDSKCGICRRARTWLEDQPAYITLRFVDVHSVKAREILPGIGKLHPEREIVVLAGNGAIYQGAHAWVMCLWATRKWREWSLRLASPALLPLAGRFVSALSNNRHRISELLGWNVDAEPETLKRRLAPAHLKLECRNGNCTIANPGMAKTANPAPGHPAATMHSPATLKTIDPDSPRN